jgi:hypothetical protein
VILNCCIGCGCDEVHACEHGGTGCWWLRSNAEDHAGVCSRCEDLIEHWERGGHALLPQLVLERFHRQVMFLYGDEASAKAWIQAPHPELYGRSPSQLIEACRLEPVYALLDRLRDGAYA